MGDYDDIIRLPHHVSEKHPPMSAIDRAAQFSPFSALTGYDAVIEETGRLTDSRIELEEYTQGILDLKQQILLDMAPEQPEITVTYFLPDERKHGGAYRKYTGKLKRVDTCHRAMIMTDGTEIDLDEIVDIDSDLFSGRVSGVSENWQ